MRTCERILSNLCTLLVALVPTLLAAQNVPEWVTKPPQSDDEYLYFVGIRSAVTTLEEGQRDAVANAVGKLVDYFGFEAQRKFELMRSELMTKVNSDFRQASSKVHLGSTYIQDWTYGRSSDDGTYEVFVLLRYPQSEFKEEKARQEQAFEARQQEALNQIAKADQLENEGQIVEAIQVYLRCALSSEGVEPRVQLRASESLFRIVSHIDLIGTSSKGDTISTLVYRGEQEQLPVGGMPMSVSMYDGTSTSNTSTRNGSVVSPSPAGTKSAQIDIDRLLLPFSQFLHNQAQPSWLSLFTQQLSGKIVRFSPIMSPLRILVLISESNGSQATTESIVANTLMKQLRDAGFKVVSDVEIGKTNVQRIGQAIATDQLVSLKPDFYRVVNIVIHGDVTAQFSSDNLGYTMSCTADGVVKATELAGGTLVASEVVANVTGFGETEFKAGKAALTKAANQLAPAIVGQLILYATSSKHE